MIRAANKIAAAIANHPGVLEAELSENSDYKYEVFLREGWEYGRGRMEHCRTGFFHSAKAFLSAQPRKVTTP